MYRDGLRRKAPTFARPLVQAVMALGRPGPLPGVVHWYDEPEKEYDLPLNLLIMLWCEKLPAAETEDFPDDDQPPDDDDDDYDYMDMVDEDPYGGGADGSGAGGSSWRVTRRNDSSWRKTLKGG
eukprot:8293326-Pyramimonas_sp.AAC.1